MISSVAGKNGNPLSAAYAPPSTRIEGLSESLRRELMLFGIDVIIVAPGAVKTPIWSKAEEIDLSVYQNSPYLPALNKVMRLYDGPRCEGSAGRADRRNRCSRR